ncbi:hypothetical protein Tco_1133652 [Tanacetum coccineum]
MPMICSKAKYAARGAQKSSWIPLLGLSSTIQILPMGNSDLISGYGSMTALEKVPVIMGKKWKIVLFRQQVLAKLGIRDHPISWVHFFAWTEIGLLRWGFRMTSEIANMRLLMVLPTLSRLLELRIDEWMIPPPAILARYQKWTIVGV